VSWSPWRITAASNTLGRRARARIRFCERLGSKRRENQPSVSWAQKVAYDQVSYLRHSYDMRHFGYTAVWKRRSELGSFRKFGSLGARFRSVDRGDDNYLKAGPQRKAGRRMRFRNSPRSRHSTRQRGQTLGDRIAALTGRASSANEIRHTLQAAQLQQHERFERVLHANNPTSQDVCERGSADKLVYVSKSTHPPPVESTSSDDIGRPSQCPGRGPTCVDTCRCWTGAEPSYCDAIAVPLRRQRAAD